MGANGSEEYKGQKELEAALEAKKDGCDEPDPRASLPPVIVKHPILTRLEALSRDFGKVCSMRAKLASDTPPEELVQSLVRNEVCTQDVAKALLRAWAQPDGWLDSIMDEVRHKFREVAELVGEGGPYLSAWWVMGATDRFHLVVVPTDDRVLLFMCTPHVPHEIVLAKAVFDPDFDRTLRGYLETLGQVVR